jgi:hypothetical protein
VRNPLNAKCGMRSAESGGNADCGMWNAKFGMRNLANAECGMTHREEAGKLERWDASTGNCVRRYEGAKVPNAEWGINQMRNDECGMRNLPNSE